MTVGLVHSFVFIRYADMMQVLPSHKICVSLLQVLGLAFFSQRHQSYFILVLMHSADVGEELVSLVFDIGYVWDLTMVVKACVSLD